MFRAAELLAEEMTLCELRKARKLTQVRVAKKLRITQDSVSRLEKRSDLLLSTLRKTVKAMGGNLSLVAEFPGPCPGRALGHRRGRSARLNQYHGVMFQRGLRPRPVNEAGRCCDAAAKLFLCSPDHS